MGIKKYYQFIIIIKKNGNDFYKQAYFSTYYERSDVIYKRVKVFNDLKNTWNSISKSIKYVYLFLHTEYKNGVSTINMGYNKTNCTSKTLLKRGFKKKSHLKRVVLIACNAAKGKKNVAYSFHQLAPNANIYASKESVSFTLTNNGYKPRYSTKYLLKHPSKMGENPIKKVY